MSLGVGARLGPYRVTAKIGEGGMGEVYRARDTKLDRDVALKVLPQAFTDDPDRLARFEREAKVLASLNHPNIGHIYGLEEAEGQRALVLELVEGPTLADRIAQGPIPVDEALPIAKQIAEALEAAHEQGVIHRDLKPANIKVKEDGTVKVLDFGLAKALDTSPEGDPSQSPTLTAAATQMGVILGTAAYMSPEQAKGKVVDKRADVWAVGAVLYEMLVGRKAFPGDDVSDTLATVLKFDPDWDALPANLHPRLREALERCLEKDVKNRYHDVADARVDIQKALTDPSEVIVRPAARARPRRTVVWIAAAVVLAALATGVAVWTLTPSPPDRLVRFPFIPPADVPLTIAGNYRDMAISPDGSRIVYVATQARRLYIRALDRVTPNELADTVEARAPFFSPDGSEVAFFVQGERSLSRMPIDGGPQQTIVADVGGGLRGASWGPDDRIVFAIEDSQGLFRVPASGGEPEALTQVEAGQEGVVHRWPETLPNGRAVLFTETSEADETSRIFVLDLERGDQSVLIADGSSPRYTPTGHIVYEVAETLWAVPFDLDSLQVSGNRAPVLESVLVKQSGAVNFDISNDGVLIYSTASSAGTSQRGLVWVDREGREAPVPTPLGNYQSLRLSPDATRAIFSMPDRDVLNREVWSSELARGTLSKLTADTGQEDYPLWTADGEHFVFAASVDGDTSVNSKAADGTGAVEQLFEANPLSGGETVPSAWSSDGQTLVFSYPQNDVDIGVFRLGGGGSWEALLDSPAAEMAPAISPGGGWIAYTSDETRRHEVYLQRFPELGDKQPVSIGGGLQPAWSPRGDELFYLRPASRSPCGCPYARASEHRTRPDPWNR